MNPFRHELRKNVLRFTIRRPKLEPVVGAFILLRISVASKVSRDRPRVNVSAGKVLREMRDERARRLLGHE